MGELIVLVCTVRKTTSSLRANTPRLRVYGQIGTLSDTLLRHGELDSPTVF